MILKEIEDKVVDKKIHTRLALLEQVSYFIQESIDRMERKLTLMSDSIEKNNDKISHKIDKFELKIEGKIKWLFNNIIMVFFSSTGLALTAYEIWRKI